MKPKERFLAAATKGVPDRVPVVYYGFGASQQILKALGLTWRDIYRDGEKIAEVMLKAYDLWGHDNVCCFLSAACGIDALGVDLTVPEMEEPRVDYVNPLLKEPRDLEKLEIPDPQRDGSMPERIRAAQILDEKIGKTVAVLGGFGGISTWAFFLRGFKNFVLDSWFDLSFQRDYMDFLTECAIRFCVAQVKAGCQWIISAEDAFASGLLGPELSWKCNGVYVKRLADAIHKAGAGYILHCCGDASLTIERMADTGADVLSLDKVDLAHAKKAVGNRVALMGNIKLHALLYESPKSVEEACREAISQGASGGGFLLSGGYMYPANTPCRSVKTLVRSAEKYACYALDKSYKPSQKGIRR